MSKKSKGTKSADKKAGKKEHVWLDDYWDNNVKVEDDGAWGRSHVHTDEYRYHTTNDSDADSNSIEGVIYDDDGVAKDEGSVNSGVDQAPSIGSKQPSRTTAKSPVAPSLASKMDSKPAMSRDTIDTNQLLEPLQYMPRQSMINRQLEDIEAELQKPIKPIVNFEIESFDDWLEGYVEETNSPRPATTDPTELGPDEVPTRSTSRAKPRVANPNSKMSPSAVPLLTPAPVATTPSPSPIPTVSPTPSLTLSPATPTLKSLFAPPSAPSPVSRNPGASMYKSVSIDAEVPQLPIATSKSGLVINTAFNAPVSTPDTSSLVPMANVKQAPAFNWSFSNQPAPANPTPPVPSVPSTSTPAQQPTIRAPLKTGSKKK